MRPMTRLSAPLAALCVAALMIVAAAASADDDDHDRARAAREAGEIRPLAEILAVVERDHPGTFLEVELERDDDRWVYEIEVLRSDGVVIELLYDAATAELIAKHGEGDDD